MAFSVAEVVAKDPIEVALCTERADFYRDTYLTWAATAQTVPSGAWNKWYRGSVTGGAWSGPDSDPYLNLYGGHCWLSYAWCAEPSIGSISLTLMVNPGDAARYEASDLSTGILDCEVEDCQLTIRVGPTREDACGF